MRCAASSAAKPGPPGTGQPAVQGTRDATAKQTPAARRNPQASAWPRGAPAGVASRTATASAMPPSPIPRSARLKASALGASAAPSPLT